MHAYYSEYYYYTINLHYAVPILAAYSTWAATAHSGASSAMCKSQICVVKEHTRELSHCRTPWIAKAELGLPQDTERTPGSTGNTKAVVPAEERATFSVSFGRIFILGIDSVEWKRRKGMLENPSLVHRPSRGRREKA